MRQSVDLTGQKFGRLTAISKNGKTNSNGWKWDCICECGKIVNVSSTNLISGTTKSCGCFKIENTSRVMLKHGLRWETEYSIWTGMKSRCYNTNEKSYPDYGGRGIIVCPRWLGENGFTNFITDMGRRPTQFHSLDRYPNNDTGIYEPTNCRWATDEQQRRNKRNNVWLECNGKKMILTDWAKEFNITTQTLFKRLKRNPSFKDAYSVYKKSGTITKEFQSL